MQRTRNPLGRRGAGLDGSGVRLSGSGDPNFLDERKPFRLRKPRVSLWVMMVFVSLTAAGIGWMIEAKRRRLADNRGRFYTHEESAVYQAFMEQGFLKLTTDAERNAATSRGPESRRWAAEAKDARRKAALCAESKRDYEYRASLKRRYLNDGR